jgi:hypothetical protein
MVGASGASTTLIQRLRSFPTSCFLFPASPNRSLFCPFLSLACFSRFLHRSGGGNPRLTSATQPQPGPVRGKGGHTLGFASTRSFALLRCELLGDSRLRPNVEDVKR